MLFDEAIKSGTLSQGDLAVVTYITQHPGDVVHMNSRELGEAAFVSPSTVVRLCKKAGFASFADMKMALARELVGEQTYRAVDSDFPQLANRGTAHVTSTITSMEREAVRKTERLLDRVAWEPLLKELEGASSVTIYALGSSRSACMGFAENLRRLGKNVTLASENYALAGQWAASCPRSELSVFVSYSGEGEHVVHPAHVLYKRGLRSVAITSDTDNKLRRLCTWHLPVALTERRFMSARMAPFQSSVATSFVLDVLYAQLFSRDYAHYTRTITKALETQGTSLAVDKDGTVTMTVRSETGTYRQVSGT